MKSSVVIFCCGSVLAIFAVVMALPSSASEPAREFLDGLRARGFHDVAIDYLDTMATSPLAPAELKETILYEKALTLVASSRLQRDPETQGKFLDDAQVLFKQFVDTQASHPKSNAARNQLGSLIFERARMEVEQSRKGDTKEHLDKAHKLYDDAFAVFASLQAAMGKELDQIPKVLDTKDRKQAKLAERRTQLRADKLQTELLSAAIREETADTVPDGSTQHIQYLSEAAELYDGIYKTYRGRLAAFYARMYQGRCNQRLGKMKDALGYYGELLDQPNASEGLFVLKTKTLRLAMECWVSPSEKKYMETIKRGSQWLAQAPANKDRETDWLAIRLSLAKAYMMQADDAKKQEPTDVRTMRESIAAAMKHAKFVASETGDLQEEAMQLVTSLGGIAATDAPTQPQTFAEAQAAGKEALDAIEPATRAVESAQALLAAENDAAAKTSLQAKLVAAQNELAITREDAVTYYRLALQLADRDTPQSDVNLVRYFLCYLFYLQQDYFQSALVGDFVSQRYPDSAGAKQCAKISLACYLTIFDTNEEADRSFEIDRLVAVANHIADTWPGSPDAEQSLSTLVPHMVNAGALDHARQLTSRIPETSALRGEAELVTGQALWGACVRQAQQIRLWEVDGPPEDVDLATERVDLESLEQSAQEVLAAGYGRLPEEVQVNTAAATALLSLAQAYVKAEKYPSAVEVLEHSQLGPLMLVDQQHTAVENPAFIEETYRTSLQAYIGTLGSGGDAILDKAKRVMLSLQESVADDESGRQRLLSVYVSLAQNVESQMRSASPEAKQEMSKVFEAFLQQLAGGATDPGTLNWVAETFAGIGAGFDDDGDVLSEDARKYYQNAIVAFQNILNQPGLPKKMATQIRVRMASVMAKIRQFPESLAVLEQVLAENPSALNVQVEAAKLLQQWGREDPSKYPQAIAGLGDKQTSNVWGWGKIATATLSHKQFRPTFYEARYELARCLLELAQTKQGGEKEKLLADASRIVSKTRQLYPTLGGVEWMNKYNALNDRILIAQGKKPSEGVNLTAPPQ